MASPLSKNPFARSASAVGKAKAAPKRAAPVVAPPVAPVMTTWKDRLRQLPRVLPLVVLDGVAMIQWQRKCEQERRRAHATGETPRFPPMPRPFAPDPDAFGRAFR
jgi:hypothetical protein